MRQKFWSILVCCAIAVTCFAQDAQIENLYLQLKQHPANDTVRAGVISRIAIAYNGISKDSMFRYCRILLDEAQQSKNTWQLAQADMIMGFYWIGIQPDEAIEYLSESYDLFKNLNEKKKMIAITNQIAATCYAKGDYEKQLFYLRRSLQEVLDIDDKKLEIKILHQISGSYFYQKNYDLAEEYSLMALQESRENDGYLLDPILIAQAGVEFQRQNYRQAINLSEEVLARAQKKGQTHTEMVCLNNIAECRIMMGQYGQARRLLEQNLRNTSLVNYDESYYASLQLLVRVDTATGNFRQALVTQRKIEMLDAQKYSLEQLQDSSHDLLQSELQKINLQLSNVGMMYEGKEEQLAKMNIFVVILIILVIGGTTWTIWTGRLLRKARQKGNELASENKSIGEKMGKADSSFQLISKKKDAAKEEYDWLEQSDRAKTRLFKTISNDLQHPLVQLQSRLTDLMATDISEEQFKRAAKELTNTVGDISLLLENLLQWSKYKSQDVQAKPQYVEVDAMINDAISQQKYGAAEKNIILANTFKHQLYVYADEDMVKSLLKTILQNTIKLSRSDANVSISSHKNNQEGWIQIHYQGQMPLQEMYLQLFREEGYNPEQSELGKAISLGWMLCRAQAEANKGAIKIENISPDAFDILLCFPLEETINKKKA